MTKDDYRSEFEEHKKKIRLDEESDKPLISTRAELHKKKRKSPKKSRLSMINIIFALFTLIPIIIICFVIFNVNSSKDASTTTGQSSQVKYETSGKKASEKDDNLLLAEKEEKEQAEKVKKEQEEKAEKEQEEKAKKEQEEKAKKEQEEKVKKEQEEKAKKEQEEKAKKEQEEKAKQAQKEKEKAESKPAPEVRTHVVAPKETFFSISLLYYNSGKGVDKIKQANGITSNEIYIGQTLTIPE